MYKYIYNLNFIKVNRHFMSTYFLLDPFEFLYYFYRIRWELHKKMSHWIDGWSLRHWFGRLGFNPRSSHTKDSKNGTGYRLANHSAL